MVINEQKDTVNRVARTKPDVFTDFRTSTQVFKLRISTRGTWDDLQILALVLFWSLSFSTELVLVISSSRESSILVVPVSSHPENIIGRGSTPEPDNSKEIHFLNDF